MFQLYYLFLGQTKSYLQSVLGVNDVKKFAYHKHVDLCQKFSPSVIWKFWLFWKLISLPRPKQHQFYNPDILEWMFKTRGFDFGFNLKIKLVLIFIGITSMFLENFGKLWIPKYFINPKGKQNKNVFQGLSEARLLRVSVAGCVLILNKPRSRW